MKKHLRKETLAVSQEPGEDIPALINKMHQQLFSLERKIDGLIRQSQGVSSFAPSYHSRDNRGQDNRQRERSFFKVICADCNKECEVPFKPSGDRPVYCKECFAKRKVGSSSFRPRHDNMPGERSFAKERTFYKKDSGENKRFGNKKRFSSHRKKRISS